MLVGFQSEFQNSTWNYGKPRNMSKTIAGPNWERRKKKRETILLLMDFKNYVDYNITENLNESLENIKTIYDMYMLGLQIWSAYVDSTLRGF